MYCQSWFTAHTRSAKGGEDAVCNVCPIWLTQPSVLSAPGKSSKLGLASTAEENLQSLWSF